MKKWIWLLLMAAIQPLFAQLPQQPQVQVDPRLQEIANPTLAATTTPEGVIGERKLSATFRKKLSLNNAALQPQTVYLYYSVTETGSIREKLNPTEARSRQDLGVTQAQLVNGRWEVILPHSGNRNGAIGSTVIEARGGQKVIYRWYVATSNTDSDLTATESFTMPRPMNIAVIGDSYSSGEGAPAPGTLWQLPGCHRSLNSGEYKAVQQFVGANPHVAVIYEPFFVSCSGAATWHIISDNYTPGFCDQNGNLVNNTEPAQFRQLQTVFEQAGKFKGDIQGKIDAVVVSVGGNDVGFGKAVEEAFKGGLAPNIARYTENLNNTLPASYDELRRFLDNQCIRYVFSTEYPDPTLNESGSYCGLPQNIFVFAIFTLLESSIQTEQNIAESMCRVGEAIVSFFAGDNNRDDCAASGLFDSPNYDYLVNYLRCNTLNSVSTGLSAAEIMGNGFIEFIQAIQASGGDLDRFLRQIEGCIPANGSPSSAHVFSTLFATQADFKAAKEGFLVPMNRMVADKIASYRSSGFPDWHFVSGSMNASRLNGMCVCDGNSRYFNSIFAAYEQQGNIHGTMHMNTRGQAAVYQPLVFSKLTQVLTYDARKNMATATCQTMPALPPVSVRFKTAFEKSGRISQDIKLSQEARFRALYERVIPVADIIKRKLDPKVYANQFVNKQFEAMRNKRLNR
nr:hypothetical protein [uncultured Arsenicibacter sp.]